ncbi:MAG: beta-propeller fold lactonase family protein, partial [Alphaproteobacteria bacterium]|nr:beta-propeller fold lactonase family protein [Alphaproteobacteria bacterium]
MFNLISGSRHLGAATLFASALFATAWAATPAVALSNIENYVFVPNRASADVAVIDTRTDKVIAKVSVGNTPHQVAVSDTLGKMITSNTADNTISIIDLETLRAVATITLGDTPEHMEISPDGGVLAVGNIEAGTISLVSISENRELKRISGLHEPHNMTFSPSGKWLYVGNLGADFVSVIDVEAGIVVKEIPVGDPKAMASTGATNEEYQGVINVTRTPDGRLGFAAYGEGDSMAVLDLRTKKKIKTLKLGDLPWRAYSTADGRFMIIPNNGDETVSIVSTSTLSEVARLKGAADMTGVNTGWFETTAFILSRGDNKAVVIDLTTMTRVGEIALPGTPETGVTTPDGKKLYIALS